MEWRKTRYEYYEVSNNGLVKSLDKIVNSKCGSKRRCKGKILKQVPDKDGYYTVTIHDKGKQFPKFVHQLVAEAFIPNDDKTLVVDHINGNRQDNRVENLRWLTVAQNNATEIARKRKSIWASNRTDNKKKINQYTKDGELIAAYDSIRDAWRQTKASVSSIIRCCKGKQKLSLGYIWRYKD